MPEITESDYAQFQAVAQPSPEEQERRDAYQAEYERLKIAVDAEKVAQTSADYTDTEMVKTAILYLQSREGQMADLLSEMLNAALPFVSNGADSVLSFEHDLIYSAVTVAYSVVNG